MRRRLPLWLALLPLALGAAFYAMLWRGWADEFHTSLSAWLPADSLAITGFPYRLEALADAPRVARGEVVQLEAEAVRARINRGPWQPDLTVVQMEGPRVSASVSPAISARLEGNTAITSINWGEGRLRRLSAVVQAARISLGGLVLPIRADTLELHLREREGEAVPGTSPTLATRGQLVISGTRLRLGSGDALTMAGEILATGPARLTSYDRWAGTGTLELTRLTLADAHGEVASVEATLVPEGRAQLRLAGTVTTVCPATLSGSPAPEHRLRVPVRLAVTGTPQALVLETPPDLSRRPRRVQDPACPKIFG
jgi:hypothetical protein